MPARKTATEVALTLLGRRDFSVSEMRQKLALRGYAHDEIDHALSRVDEMGYLNDGRYAQRFVSDRSRFRGWGPRRLKHELQKRQITETDISAALQHWQEEGEHGEGTDWAEQAAALLNRRFGAWENLPPEEKARRINFLLRRGYNTEIATRALDLTRTDGA